MGGDGKRRKERGRGGGGGRGGRGRERERKSELERERERKINLFFSIFSCCVLCHNPDVWSEHLGGCHSHVGCLYDYPSHVWLHAPPWDQRQCHFSCQPCHGECSTTWQREMFLDMYYSVYTFYHYVDIVVYLFAVWIPLSTVLVWPARSIPPSPFLYAAYKPRHIKRERGDGSS